MLLPRGVDGALVSGRNVQPASNRPRQPMDHRIVLIAVAVAVAAVIVYALVMRVFFSESKELDKKIDYSKMKEWKDED